MITTPTVSGKPGQAPTGLSYDLYPLIGSHSTWTDPRGPVTDGNGMHEGTGRGYRAKGRECTADRGWGQHRNENARCPPSGRYSPAMSRQRSARTRTFYMNVLVASIVLQWLLYARISSRTWYGSVRHRPSVIATPRAVGHVASPI